MNRKALICGLAAALLVTGACSSASTTPAAKQATATPPPASPAATKAPEAAAADANAAAQDFTLVNETGVVIDKVFISPHSSDDWEEDILGQDVLANGEKVDIKFHRSQKAPLWDLKIADKEGHSIEWENLNLLHISKLTLEYKDGKATANAE